MQKGEAREINSALGVSRLENRKSTRHRKRALAGDLASYYSIREIITREFHRNQEFHKSMICFRFE